MGARPSLLASRASQRDLASKKLEDELARAQDIAAAAWVAGLAIASEVVQGVNTAAVIFAFQRTSGTLRQTST